MFERRDVLKAAAGVIAAQFAPSVGFSQQQQQQPSQAQPPAPPPFSRDFVVELAKSLASRPYAPAAADLREPFANLTYEQYVGIKTKPDAAIWAGENRSFVLEPLHRGFIFTAPVEIYIVENHTMQRLAYDFSKFDYGALKITDKPPDVGFSGFRVLTPQKEGPAPEVAIFQGASFYRAAARGQRLGVTARGLSIRTADPRGEEFPAFRIFWIEKPAVGENVMVIHALLDSTSLTGAYRFTLRPGEATIIDTEMTLFPRAAVDHYGVAGFSAASFFTPLDHRRADDVRSMVAETNGLQMLTGKDEWLWRPVSNRDTLQISAFVDADPKGYGFLLRDRDISDYQDDDQHWEQRPSLWVEPLGDWGEGTVQLVEVPSESETNENILSYWRPKAPLAAGKSISFAYRQFWCWTPPARTPLAIADDARGGRSPLGAKLRRFVVVFSGDILANPQRTANLKAALTTSPGSATNVRTFLDPQAKTCRVVFDVDPAGETFCELRLVLQSGDDPISETWLYRWTP
jgi:periplasmic glucans biosynthesis protein